MDDVSRETICRYVAKLLKWNRAHNLIARSDESNIWERHVLNCMPLVECIGNGWRVVDVGSGGGFPGVLVSVLRDVDLYLVEANVKKAIFLREVSRDLSLDYSVVNKRVEDFFVDEVDCVISRGFSSVSKIFDLTAHFVSRETKYVLLKGDNVMYEIDEALKWYSFEYDILSSKKTRVLVVKSVLKRDG